MPRGHFFIYYPLICIIYFCTVVHVTYWFLNMVLLFFSAVSILVLGEEEKRFVSRTRTRKYVNHFCRIALRAKPNFWHLASLAKVCATNLFFVLDLSIFLKFYYNCCDMKYKVILWLNFAMQIAHTLFYHAVYTCNVLYMTELNALLFF